MNPAAPTAPSNPAPAAAPAGGAKAATIFELDGNAQQGGGIPPEDWATLYAAGANTGGLSNAFTTIIADPGQSTIFTGGRKDIQDLNQWSWKGNGGFPDKDDITNAYAAAYNAPNNDLILYFGADRFANNGDAFLGFWFFQDTISLNANGTFSGVHVIGDVLVLVNYPQASNASPQFLVVEWNPPLANVATNLRLVSSGILCGDVPPADVCATTNGATVPSPWPYVPKSGASGSFPYESFFEGGVNLTALGFQDVCFSSFLAETRSSAQFSATLKDFALGSFPLCSLSVSKTCAVTNCSKPFNVDFTATVLNDGGSTFAAGSLLTVIDDAGTPNTPGDDVIIQKQLVTALAPGQTVSVSGSFQSQSFPPYNTVDASIDTGQGVVNAKAPFGIECTVPPCNPDLLLTKTCALELETVGNLLAVRVHFWGSVQNTGDVPLLVTVTDDEAGVVLGPDYALAVGATANIEGFYYPVSANGGTTNPCDAMFDDTFTAVGKNPDLGKTVSKVITANCALCPCQ